MTNYEGEKMNKAELIDAIAQELEVPKAAAGRFIDSFVHHIIKNLSKGESVVIPGLGSFVVSNRAARKGRNPQTGAEIKIAASRVARFRPAKKLKDSVSGK